MKQPISQVFNGDCMEYMAGLPDKFFDLVIADPPYGIFGEGGASPQHSGGLKKKNLQVGLGQKSMETRQKSGTMRRAMISS